MTDLQTALFALADPDYAAFQAKLTPTVSAEKFLGVRMPALRRFAAQYGKTEDAARFLGTLPHDYQDENLLHAILLGNLRDFERCLHAVDAFLPYVDNWAVCDSLRPACFKRHREELLPHIRHWIASPTLYTCRFGIEMLMLHFLDETFDPSLLELPAAVESEEYYVRMMVAWFFASALTKQWDAALPYITQRRLPEWTHRKAIQKACESYLISTERKTLLKKLRT